MESMKRIGRTAEQEATTILNEQDAIILYENSAQQTAHILTLPLRTDSTTSTEEAVLAPVAKRLPPIFAGSLSPDTGRTIPQFSGEEVISPNDCEAVDIVLANGNNSIFLQTLRKASKQLETREKISLNSLADRIYGTVLGNRSIDDYDKFVRLKIILIEYIGTNEQRARKLLPLRIPQFGALQQLLACR
ncbi:hypothetical protein Tcan_05033 [Toxocara canis]|uniref:Uncharacterized protein n=2 Tax=Toxocara canis TaxID=6265 RepID=A0A0B2V8M5_TOXCA|nr:hypothetical protein Tcan_05033 [Toxocara canis]VDM45620.1 unnamed protein product [Toxocara canis]